MILLVLVAVLWIVVLVPSALRRRSEHRGAGSIDHFHHQLQLLEHAGPKLVQPAYRLHTAMPGGEIVSAYNSSEVVSSRPKLVLVRPVDEDDSYDIDGSDGAHYERVRVLDAPEPPTSPVQPREELSRYRREEARRRCTIALRCLTTAAIGTGLLGMLPSLHLAWIFTAITGVAALALVGLIAYAKEVESQLARRRPRYELQDFYDDIPTFGGAEAGYPGGWDEEYDELPREAAAH